MRESSSGSMSSNWDWVAPRKAPSKNPEIAEMR